MKFKPGDIIKFCGPSDHSEFYPKYNRYKVINSYIVPANENITGKDYERIDFECINDIDFSELYGMPDGAPSRMFELADKPKSHLPSFI